MKKELLRVGVWNKTVKVSLERLKTISNNFNNTVGKNADGYRVPLFLGHPDDPSTAPAKGWLSKVWVKGQSLFGEFADITQEATDEIKKKIFRDVSVGFNQNKLVHVALTNNPAVSNLGDFFANSEATELINLSQIQEDVMPELKEVLEENAKLKAKNEGLSGDLQTVKNENAELTSQVDESKKEVATLTKERDDAKSELDKNIEASEKAELARIEKEDSEFVDSLIKDKKLFPRKREITLATIKSLRSSDVKLSLEDEDGKTVEKTALEACKDELLAADEVIEGGETFTGGRDRKTVKETKLEKLTNEYASKNNVDFATAGMAVMSEHPELAAEA